MYAVGDYVVFKDSEPLGLTGYVYAVSDNDPHMVYVQLDGKPGQFMHSPGWAIMDDYLAPSSAEMYGTEELTYFSSLAEYIRERLA